MSKKYQDVERKVILLKDIEDILPYEVLLPKPPKPQDIKNFGLPIEEQFYKREYIPKKVWDITKALNMKSIKREDAINAVMKDAELEKWIEGQWGKRVEGEWQYIRGKPIYFTGDNWFFLNYYHMDVGLPQFRMYNTEKFYWWKFCVEDNPHVFGGIDFTKRRDGKTFFSGNVLLSYTTRAKNANSGIQSKSDDDAYKFFHKAVSYPFRRLPFFWKPNHTLTKYELNFSHENIEESLESLIDFKPSTATAYDGQKLHRFILDEAGKMEDPADPVEIWDKVKFCLQVDNKIIGKALVTTTVEDMEKGGGEKFKFIWDESCLLPKMEKVMPNGRTQSGLIPYFTSSYYNEILDQYGFSIVGTPLPYQQAYLEKIKDPTPTKGGMQRVDEEIASVKNPNQKQKLIRKKPPTIRDAFRYSNNGCLYDIDIINNRLVDFRYGYPHPMTFGYFKWKKERFGDVEFVATASEKHELTRVHIRYLPSPDLTNLSYMKNGKRHPANTARFNASADPFKLKTEQVKYKKDMSLGGAHIYALYDPNIDSPQKPREEWLTDNFCVEYLFRPDTPDEYVEDMAMMCIFYGCKIFPEPNIPIVDDLFREWGLQEYLQFSHKRIQRGSAVIYKEDKKVAGEYNTEYFRPTLIRHGINFIKEKGMYCPFYRTLEQMRDMSYTNFNDFDLGVSALYCLTGVFDIPMTKKGESKSKFTLDGLIPNLRSY